MKKTSLIYLYKDNKDKNGNFDELVLNFYNNRYTLSRNVDWRELAHVVNSKITAHKLDTQAFDHIFNAISNEWCGQEEFFELSYECRMSNKEKLCKEERNNPLIGKETMWKALKGEMSEDEICRLDVVNSRIEKDFYYNLDVLLRMVNKFKNGEISGDYMNSWYVVAMQAFYNVKTKSLRLKEIFDDMAWMFDGEAFFCHEEEGERIKNCNAVIASLKYYDHDIRCIQNNKKTTFCKNGISVYVSFVAYASDGYVEITNVCVVDEIAKEYNVYYEYDYDYDAEINYTFVNEKEFLSLMSKYYEYKFNRNLKIENQKRKR